MLVEMVVSNDTGLIALLVCIELGEAFLLALSADAACELHVLGHDGNAASVDGAEVGVLEEADKVGLGRLLQSHNGGGLEAEVGLEVLRHLADEALEGGLLDQKIRRLLVLADLTEGDGAGAVAAGLLGAISLGGLARSLGGKLLARGLAAGGLAGRLLRARHSD